MAESDWVDESDWEDEGPAQEKMGKLEAGARGFTQGALLGFGDELGGLMGKLKLGESSVRLGNGAQLSEDDTPEVRAIKLELAQQQAASPTAYETVRDLMRKDYERARQDQPGAYMAGEVVGGAALPMGAAAKGAGTGAKLLRATLGGSGLGAAYGLGSSEADVARQRDIVGAARDTAVGAGLGAAGGALGEGVVAPLAERGGRLLSRSLQKLRGRADQGIIKAQEMAVARAGQELGEELDSLTGKLGAETQKGSRMTENIRRIPGEMAEATPEGQAAMMRDAARIARQRAEDLAEEATAQGVGEAPASVGEFLSRGSKKDSAQRGSSQAKRLLDGAKQLEDDAEKVLRGELSPKQLNANLAQARQIALESPAFKQLEGTVLSENLRRLPQQVGEIEAARAARDVAAKNLKANTANRAQELLSGKAAASRGKELLKRYALPAVGGYVGQELGDEFGPIGQAAGLGLGWKMGSRATGALAGAGLRPMAQALYRTATQYPAVSNLGWRGVRSLASAPETLTLGTALQAALPPLSRTEESQMMLRALAEAVRKRRRLSGAEPTEDDGPLASQ